MNLLLLFGTVVGVAAILLSGLIQAATGYRIRALLLAGAAGGWATLYAAGLLATSLSSHEVLLPVGATKRFCGFYLDCHIGVAVVEAREASALGDRRAGGVYRVVTLRVSSNALRAALTPGALRVDLVGTDGRRYARDLLAEAALPRAGGALEREIPAGGAYEVTVVFDVPAGVSADRLFVGEGRGVDLAIERMLIGDDDSFLHARTMLALPVSS